MNFTKVIKLLLIIFFASCNTPSPERKTPKGAYSLYIHALSTQKYDKIYEMLASNIRAEIEETHKNIKSAYEIILSEYPPSVRERTFEMIGGKKYLETKTPLEFFSMAMGTQKPPSLSFSERLGSMVKEIIEENGITTIITLAKDKYKFQKEKDGLYYFIPDDEDIKAIHNGLLRSRETLQKIKKELENLKNL